MNKEERLKAAAEDDWGVVETKRWQAADPLVFTSAWYYTHLYLILYMLIGFGILMYQIANGDVYRVLTIVTWPWLLTSSKFVYLVSLTAYAIAVILITTPVIKQVRNFPLNVGNLAYFFIYYLGLFLMFMRFILLLVTPEPMEIPYFSEQV